MSGNDPESDLLSPSLAEHHDADGFDRPWNPQSVVYAAFFGGPIAAAVLFGSNFKRLGIQNGAVVSALVFAAVAIAYAIVTAAYLPEIQERGVQRMFRFGLQGVTVAIGLAVAARQRPRFRVFTGHGGEPQGLWVTGLVVVIVSAVLQFVLMVVARIAIHPFVED